VVRQLSEWAAVDPAEERVRDYFLYLIRDRGFAAQTLRQARAALTAFYVEMLGCTDWKIFATIKTKDAQKLPVVLSREEVRRLLGAVREPRYRVCLRLIYECGLRLSEGRHLQPRDIARDDLRLRVRLGKGAKDRYVPLSQPMIEELTWWWKQHRNQQWMFPGAGYDWKSGLRPKEDAQQATMALRMKFAKHPLSESSLQTALRAARRDSGIKHHATVHTLRHSYATHLLEEGVSIRYVSQYLGHANLEQTLVYTHLTNVSEAQTRAALARLSASTRLEVPPA
jgi:integrase/recombinase XerD